MTDREKAIEILQRLADGKAEELYIFDDEGGDVCGQILEEQDAILAGIEALKAERPHGEWITTSNIWEDDDLSGWGYYKECSRCHNQERRRTPFCPNCGADLRPKGGDPEWKSEV